MTTSSLHPVQPAAAPSAIPVWVGVAAVAGAVLMSAGALIAMLKPAMLSGPAEINSAVRVYADYFAVRNLALPVMLLIFLVRRARQSLAAIMLTVALIQFLDACFDIFEARWTIIPGVMLIGVVFLAAAVRLYKLERRA